MKAIVPRGSSLEIKYSLFKLLKSNMYSIPPPCLDLTLLLIKHVKACNDQKGEKSWKNTLKRNERKKNRDKKKNLGLPPKQLFF